MERRDKAERLGSKEIWMVEIGELVGEGVLEQNFFAMWVYCGEEVGGKRSEINPRIDGFKGGWGNIRIGQFGWLWDV